MALHIQDKPLVRLAERGELRLMRELIGARRAVRSRSVPQGGLALTVRGGKAFIAPETDVIDLETFEKVYACDQFPLDCKGRIVVDVGAHKGYFGVWALARGAVMVVSCEPQSQNFAYMERACSSNRRGDRWELRKVAVGRTPGVTRLYVSAQSWGHSLYSDLAGSETFEEVQMVTLSSIISECRERMPSADVTLKVNVEGAAAEVCLSADPNDLGPVREVRLDYEPGSHYDIGELLAHLASGGLTDVKVSSQRWYVIRRAR